MKTSKYLRKASRNFLCECCNKQIDKGEEYIDFETVDYHSNNSVTVLHRRLHKHCDKAKAKYSEEDLPLPVAYDGVKERLVGKVVIDDDCFLLVQDWDEPFKYHKRKSVYDSNGQFIKPEDVRL